MVDYDAVYAVADEMMLFANGLNSGHVKHWKAQSICVELAFTVIQEHDKTVMIARMFDYVRKCLKMEGFTEEDCLAVTFFLNNRMNLLANDSVN